MLEIGLCTKKVQRKGLTTKSSINHYSKAMANRKKDTDRQGKKNYMPHNLSITGQKNLSFGKDTSCTSCIIVHLYQYNLVQNNIIPQLTLVLHEK